MACCSVLRFRAFGVRGSGLKQDLRRSGISQTELLSTWDSSRFRACSYGVWGKVPWPSGQPRAATHLGLPPCNLDSPHGTPGRPNHQTPKAQTGPCSLSVDCRTCLLGALTVLPILVRGSLLNLCYNMPQNQKMQAPNLPKLTTWGRLSAHACKSRNSEAKPKPAILKHPKPQALNREAHPKSMEMHKYYNYSMVNPQKVGNRIRDNECWGSLYMILKDGGYWVSSFWASTITCKTFCPKR